MPALCNARLAGPLARLLDARNADPDLIPGELQTAKPEDRVPVAVLHDALERAAERLGQPVLGLELGMGLCLGEFGPFDYVLRSAPSAQLAFDAASRYAALHADGYRVSFEPWRGGHLMRMVDETSWPRVVADLALASSYRLHVDEHARHGSVVECWFPYVEPADPSVYERCFRGARLRFRAPFHALVLDAAYTRAPRPAADPSLHELLCQRLNIKLLETARASSLQSQARTVIERQLREQQEVSAASVSRALLMNSRTLRRRLQESGTTFVEELDAVRHRLALEYVAQSDGAFNEVAFKLGFAHNESFYRAFKRWTGTTPRLHRRTAVTSRR